MRIKDLTSSAIKITTLAAALVLFGSCRSGHSRTQDENETPDFDTSVPLPEGIVEFSKAIKDGDARKFAGHVSYPLSRPYPLRDIIDSAKMVSYFPVMVDDSLRSVFAEAGRKDWSQAGWRGWTLDAGQYVWYEDGIYAFPYLSKAEKKMLREAIDRDLSTLSPELRAGWEPVMCVASASPQRLYRIDRNLKTHRYRLLEYTLPGKLDGKPGRTMEGEQTTDGTMENRTFDFTEANGQTATFSPDASDDSEMTIDFSIPGSENVRSVPVLPVYWIDFVKK